VSAEHVAETIKRLGGRNARYASSFDEAIRELMARANPGDMIMTLGAGNVSYLGPQIVAALETRERARPIPA